MPGRLATILRNHNLSPLIRVLAFVIIINGLGLIQRTILIKNVDFKRQAKITVISAIISGILGIAMAYRGWGVWSLVWLSVAHNLVTVITFYGLGVIGGRLGYLI